MPGLWDWIPGESVGPFRFGDPVEDFIELYDLRKLEPDGTSRDSYDMPGWESGISFKEGRLVSVDCWDSCLFNGVELLGMPFTDFRDILGPEEEMSEGIGWGVCAHYLSRLGLSLFVGEDGMITSTSCGPLIEEESDGPSK